MQIRPLFILFFFLFNMASILAQDELAVKWGKVTPDEWRITRCIYDTTADALVLFDKGQVEFRYGSAIVIQRHTRLKILSAKGLEEGNISIPFYVENQLEKITDVDAQTINADASGKALIQKVTGKEIFDVAENERWHEKRFSFPSVKVGSILEYRYTTLSKRFTFLDAWAFQNHLPTLHSEFRALINAELDYRYLMQGSRLLQKYRTSGNVWSLQNLPALKPEPYVANYLNYAEKIQFQLAGYNKRSPQGNWSYENLMTSWEKLAEERLEDENYRRYLNRHGLAKDILSKVLIGSESDLEKAKKLYRFAQNTLAWDGTYARFTQKSLNEALESQKANSSEINLFLVLLLKEAGLEAAPVLISTRKHGVVHKGYPFLSQFNHVLANVRIQAKDYLLDAIDPFRPFDQLAVTDLVESGYLLDKSAPRWINIPSATESKQITFIEGDLSDPAKPAYKIDDRYSGYLALEQRKVVDTDEKEGLRKNLSKLHPTDYQLANLSVTDGKEVENPLVLNYTLSPEEGLKNDIIYLNPVLVNHFTENPFKNEIRSLPVELGYPHSYVLIISLKVPEGYQVQELPANQRLALPEQIAEFSYMASTSNQLIQIRTNVNFKKALIPNEYYGNLREFYTQIIAKYREQVVLRKNP